MYNAIMIPITLYEMESFALQDKHLSKITTVQINKQNWLNLEEYNSYLQSATECREEIDEKRKLELSASTVAFNGR